MSRFESLKQFREHRWESILLNPVKCETVGKAGNWQRGNRVWAATTSQPSLSAPGSLESVGSCLKTRQSINKLFSPPSQSVAGNKCVCLSVCVCVFVCVCVWLSCCFLARLVLQMCLPTLVQRRARAFKSAAIVSGLPSTNHIMQRPYGKCLTLLMAHAANNGKKRGPGGVERALVIVGFLVWVCVNAFRFVCWLNVATGVERCEKKKKGERRGIKASVCFKSNASQSCHQLLDVKPFS